MVSFRAGQNVKFVPDHKSFGEFILSEQMRDVTAEVCGDIADLATVNVPVPQSDTDPERSQALYHVKREAGTFKVGGNVRVKCEVYSEDPGAGRAEFGTRNHRRYRTLGRAGGWFGDWTDKESE